MLCTHYVLSLTPAWRAAALPYQNFDLIACPFQLSEPFKNRHFCSQEKGRCYLAGIYSFEVLSLGLSNMTVKKVQWEWQHRYDPDSCKDEETDTRRYQMTCSGSPTEEPAELAAAHRGGSTKGLVSAEQVRAPAPGTTALPHYPTVAFTLWRAGSLHNMCFPKL